jgi:hypothetical protein
MHSQYNHNDQEYGICDNRVKISFESRRCDIFLGCVCDLFGGLSLVNLGSDVSFPEWLLVSGIHGSDGNGGVGVIDPVMNQEGKPGYLCAAHIFITDGCE